MNLRLLCALSLASTLPLGACADATIPGPEGPQVEIGVAPLTLPGATDACYKIGVYNGDPGEDPNSAVENGVDTVWTQDNICASQYGGNNGITYVGTCDASVSPGTDNYIALTIEGLYSGGAQGTGTEISADTYRNPCPNDAPCIQHFECKENADVFVEFNLTIMRDAQQGFFDIAVNFEDVFCSAKFDTCYAAEQTTAGESHDVDGGSSVSGIRYLEGTTAILAVPQKINEREAYRRYTLSEDASDATATATDFYSQETVARRADATIKAVRTLTFVDATAGTSTTATIKDSALLEEPIELLFGTGGRQHTAVAAFACSAGAESSVDTELVFGPVIVACQKVTTDEQGNTTTTPVTFSIDLSGAVNTTPGDGAAGNHTVTEIAENGTHTLNYALYYGDETLACENGALGSCNKVYYNIAFNIEKLAEDNLSGCGFLSFATAQDTAHPAYDATTGAFALDNAAYPLIGFANTDGDKPAPIPFDTAGCTINPVNGEGSHVKTHYIDGTKAGGEAAYHSTGDAATKYGNAAVANLLKSLGL